MRSPFLILPFFISFSNVSSSSLLNQSGSFALPVVMGCTGITLLSRSTLTHEPQWTPLPGSGLEETPSSNERCMDCIVLAVYFNSQATENYASEPKVRGAFFWAIPQSNDITIIKIKFGWHEYVL